MPFPRIGSVPFPVKPYLLGKPLPGRRQPVKAASREAVARNAPALTGWRWSGLLASKQTRFFPIRTYPASAVLRTSPPPQGAQANKRSLLAGGISIGTSVVDGNIFNSKGVHVGVVRGDAIFGLRGQKLYDLKDSNIYKLNGDLVGHLSDARGKGKRLDKATDKLFPPT